MTTCVFAQGKTRVRRRLSRRSPAEEALRLYTMGSAGNAFMEDCIGSLEPRNMLTFAVLSERFSHHCLR